jgi:DNA-binding winged helix-turn-helix (wHTH) protein
MHTLTRSERIAVNVSDRCPCCGGPLAENHRLRVDLGTNTLFGYGVAIIVPPRHAELCFVLAEAWPNLVRRQDIIAKLWPHQIISDKLLDTTICLTRRYVERIGYSIRNEYAIGYRLLRMMVQP